MIRMSDPLYLDIVFMRGSTGGFENSLNRASSYFAGHGVHVRYVQMIKTDVSWAVPEVEFVCFDMDPATFQFADGQKRYEELLRQGPFRPSLILAAGWPYTVFIAKGAVVNAGLSVPVGAWPHGDEKQYAETHVGDFGAYKYADVCFALSNQIEADMKKRWPDKTVYRVNNTFDENSICYSGDRNTTRIAYVGRLADIKSVETLLYAMEKTDPCWELDVVGDGFTKDSLVALAKELDLTERVHFRGWSATPWTDVRYCRAFVNASLYEAGPLTVMEALASGMPVLSTPVGFVPDLVTEGENGSILPFRDAGAFADAINALADTPFTAQQAQICRDSVREYSREIAFPDFLQKIREAAGVEKQSSPSKKAFTIPPSFLEDEVREGFFVCGMMKRYWAAQMQVLSEIDRICQRNGIQWYIDSGSLLGAVRHGGFIPWDDDLDIIMMRHDLERFVELARKELPSGWHVADLLTDETFDSPFTRVMNALSISDELKKEEHGCPYPAGVDIFALDGVSPDAETEKTNRKQFKTVCHAGYYLKYEGRQSANLKRLLTEIEQEMQIRIPDDETMEHRLNALMLELNCTVSSENAALLKVWLNNGDIWEFEPSWFSGTVSMPFEFLSVPAPAGYDKVLKQYYGDYRIAVRGTGAHDYPAFRRNEKKLSLELGHNVLRYTIKEEHLDGPRPPSLAGKVEQMTVLLQKTKDMLEQAVLREDPSAVQMLSSTEQLVHKLEVATRAMKRQREVKDVLFLPCRASWWDTMEPLYREACNAPGLQPVIMPVPWRRKHTDGTVSENHDESAFFAERMPVVTKESYPLETMCPAVVVTQFPYDNTGADLEIDTSFHTQYLRSVADCLVYVPPFVPDAPEEKDFAAKAMLRYLVEQPAVVFADKTYIPADALRSAYIEALCEITGEHRRGEWKKRIIGPHDIYYATELVYN